MERHPLSPLLTREHVPASRPGLVDVSAVFNPGAVRIEGRDRLVLRVQTRGRRTVLMRADEAAPGSLRFDVDPAPVEIDGLDAERLGIFHVYDPRLTRIGEDIFMVFAADTDEGCRLGVARSSLGLDHFELAGYDEAGDRRNGVLFPERVGGRYLRLERPNDLAPGGGPPTGDRIVLAESDDLVTWREVAPVMSGRPRYWDERIGSGPPPFRTPAGWLHVYHGVATHFAACNVYQAGVILLDADDPSRLLARSGLNILEPRELWELTGQVPGVVFPSGLTTGAPDERGCVGTDEPVRVYYGAADTCVGLAVTTAGELLEQAEG